MRKKITFLSGGNKIRGMLFIPKEERGGICICHGIPMVAKPVEGKGYPDLAEKFCSVGFVTMIFNFRGTVGSDGYFSFSGWSEDLFSAVDFLSSKVDKIGILGFSGGAIVSVYNTAIDKRIRFLMSCSCPTEIKRIIPRLKENYMNNKDVLRISDL
ncbi:MAG: alpha/beta hydrolase, partial [Candidatus Syntropharchaeia archaeon]